MNNEDWILNEIKGFARAKIPMTPGVCFGFVEKPKEIKGVYPNEKKKIVVVKFNDNSVVKVKCQKEDNFDIYVGVALAYCYKKYGTNSQFRKFVDKVTIKNKEKKENVKSNKQKNK